MKYEHLGQQNKTVVASQTTPYFSTGLVPALLFFPIMDWQDAEQSVLKSPYEGGRDTLCLSTPQWCRGIHPACPHCIQRRETPCMSAVQVLERENTLHVKTGWAADRYTLHVQIADSGNEYSLKSAPYSWSKFSLALPSYGAGRTKLIACCTCIYWACHHDLKPNVLCLAISCVFFPIVEGPVPYNLPNHIKKNYQTRMNIVLTWYMSLFFCSKSYLLAATLYKKCCYQN